MITKREFLEEEIANFITGQIANDRYDNDQLWQKAIVAYAKEKNLTRQEVWSLYDNIAEKKRGYSCNG